MEREESDHEAEDRKNTLPVVSNKNLEKVEDNNFVGRIVEDGGETVFCDATIEQKGF